MTHSLTKSIFFRVSDRSRLGTGAVSPNFSGKMQSRVLPHGCGKSALRQKRRKVRSWRDILRRAGEQKSQHFPIFGEGQMRIEAVLTPAALPSLPVNLMQTTHKLIPSLILPGY